MEARFRDSIEYARKPLEKVKIEEIMEGVTDIEQMDDVRALIPLLLI